MQTDDPNHQIDDPNQNQIHVIHDSNGFIVSLCILSAEPPLNVINMSQLSKLCAYEGPINIRRKGPWPSELCSAVVSIASNAEVEFLKDLPPALETLWIMNVTSYNEPLDDDETPRTRILINLDLKALFPSLTSFYCSCLSLDPDLMTTFPPTLSSLLIMKSDVISLPPPDGVPHLSKLFLSKCHCVTVIPAYPKITCLVLLYITSLQEILLKHHPEERCDVLFAPRLTFVDSEELWQSLSNEQKAIQQKNYSSWRAMQQKRFQDAILDELLEVAMHPSRLKTWIEPGLLENSWI